MTARVPARPVWPAAKYLGIGWALAVGALVGTPAAARLLQQQSVTLLTDVLAAAALAFGAWLAAARLESLAPRPSRYAIAWAVAGAVAFAWFAHAPIDRQTDDITIDFTSHTTVPTTYGVGHVTQGTRTSFGSWRALESMALFGLIVGLATGWSAARGSRARRMAGALVGGVVWSACVVVGGHATVVMTYGSGMVAGMTLGAPFAAVRVMPVAFAIVFAGGAVGAWFTGAAMSWTAWKLQAPR